MNGGQQLASGQVGNWRQRSELAPHLPPIVTTRSDLRNHVRWVGKCAPGGFRQLRLWLMRGQASMAAAANLTDMLKPCSAAMEHAMLFQPAVFGIPCHLVDALLTPLRVVGHSKAPIQERLAQHCRDRLAKLKLFTLINQHTLGNATDDAIAAAQLPTIMQDFRVELVHFIKLCVLPFAGLAPCKAVEGSTFMLAVCAHIQRFYSEHAQTLDIPLENLAAAKAAVFSGRFDPASQAAEICEQYMPTNFESCQLLCDGAAVILVLMHPSIDGRGDVGLSVSDSRWAAVSPQSVAHALAAVTVHASAGAGAQSNWLTGHLPMHMWAHMAAHLGSDMPAAVVVEDVLAAGAVQLEACMDEDSVVDSDFVLSDMDASELSSLPSASSCAEDSSVSFAPSIAPSVARAVAEVFGSASLTDDSGSKFTATSNDSLAGTPKQSDNTTAAVAIGAVSAVTPRRRWQTAAYDAAEDAVVSLLGSMGPAWQRAVFAIACRAVILHWRTAANPQRQAAVAAAPHSGAGPNFNLDDVSDVPQELWDAAAYEGPDLGPLG